MSCAGADSPRRRERRPSALYCDRGTHEINRGGVVGFEGAAAVKKIKAWAVLTPKDREDYPDSLRAYGNGSQFQLPIFDMKKEAQAWRAEAKRDRGRIVRCLIEVIDR